MFTAGNAQNNVKTQQPEAALACPGPATLTQQQLYGSWALQWLPAVPGSLAAPSSAVAASPLGTRLELSANPEYPDSLIGTLAAGAQRHLLAGDWEEGVLTLEESIDGKSISANWAGQLVPESCGREIRGTWLSAKDSARWGFVLRRVAQW